MLQVKEYNRRDSRIYLCNICKAELGLKEVIQSVTKVSFPEKVWPKTVCNPGRRAE